MRRKFLAALFSVMLVNGVVLADGAPKAGTPEYNAAVEKLGAVRLRVTAKLADLQKLTTIAADGINAAYSSLQTQYQQSSATWTKRIQQEAAKPADTRDQTVIDSLSGKVDKANTMWNAQTYKDGPAFAQQLADQQAYVTQLGTLIATFTPIDQNWLRADLEPAKLTAVFETIDKRIDDITAVATPLVENYKKFLADREHSLQD